MKKILALIKARNLEFYRDRVALAWTIIFPFIVLAGFTYGYSGKSEPILRVVAADSRVADSPPVKTLLEIPGVELKTTGDAETALKRVTRFEADLALEMSPSGEKLIYAITPESERGKLGKLLLERSNASATHALTLEARELTGKRIRYSDWLLPGLLAMNIMFGSMFGVGYVIVRYRKNGVLKRLRATPLSAVQFLVSQVASRMLLMVLTSFLVIAGAMLLIGFRPANGWSSIVDLLVFLSISSAAMISVGLVVAARISSEEVADGVLNLMTWPMIFLSGIWFSLEGASKWVVFISKAMPLTYVVDGLRSILIDGTHVTALLPQMLVLVIISAVLVTIGSILFRWR